MKHIVLFGAGKSATCLINFLLGELGPNNWKLTVCDNNLALAQSKTGSVGNAFALQLSVEDDGQRNDLIRSADIVISMLPPELHFIVAKDCVKNNRNLLTASYVDENINTLSKEISDKGLLFLCEMGLDPGIDHMSAMKLIKSIRENEGTITSFMSHCGGLIAPESDDNPWHYKITWNPRNVVLAGQDGAIFLKDTQTVKLPYYKVFKDAATVDIPGLQPLAWYPNRDSMRYVSLYSLENVSTFIRTTLRHPSFCRGWQKFVTSDCTSTKDFEQIKHCKTFRDWFNAKVSPYVSDEITWTSYLQIYITDPYKNEFRSQLNFFGYNTEDPLPPGFTCSADILQHVMETKLTMQPDDKDMIIMLHQIDYDTIGASGNSVKKQIDSCLVLKGESKINTAMAKAVGLPLGIATKLILQNKIKLTGLRIPIAPEIYEPVLKELEEHGITFSESSQTLTAP